MQIEIAIDLTCMYKMRHITTEQELDTILNENKDAVVVLDIYATWCGPCQRLAPHLDEFEKKYDIVLVKVDVDKVEHGREKDDNGVRKNPLLRRFELKTIPHVRVWAYGEEVYVGDSDHEKLENVLIETILEQSNAQHVRFSYMDGEEKTVLCTIAYACNEEYDEKYVLNELNEYFPSSPEFPLEDRLSKYLRNCIDHLSIVRPDNCSDERCLHEVVVDSNDLSKVTIN